MRSGLVFICAVGVLALGLPGAALAVPVTWKGETWETQPIPGYTSGTVSINGVPPNDQLWTVTNTSAKTSWIPYGGTYAERLSLAKLVLDPGEWVESMTNVRVFDPGSAAGWSVVIKNSAGKWIDFGVRPMFSTGYVRGNLYDGAAWSGYTNVTDRPKTGNDYFWMNFTTLHDPGLEGYIRVDLSWLKNGVPGGPVSWTTPSAFGNMEEVYVVGATSGSVGTTFKWTDFQAEILPEPATLALLGVAGLMLARRRASR